MATRLNLNFLFRSRQEADKKAKTRIIYFDHNMSTALCVGIVLALLSFRGTLAEQDCQTNLSAGGTVTINCRGLGITSFPNTGNATTV